MAYFASRYEQNKTKIKDEIIKKDSKMKYSKISWYDKYKK